jgi:hypothetical protein
VLLCGCGATTLFASGPEARPDDTALSLARFLADEALRADSTSAPETECYPVGGGRSVAWDCFVRGVLSPQQDPLGQGLNLSVGYRPAAARFVELGRSARAPQLPFGSVPERTVLGAKPVQLRTGFDLERVSCAQTRQAAWCGEMIYNLRRSPPVPLTLRARRVSAADVANLQWLLDQTAAECDQPPYCAPPISAYK